MPCPRVLALGRVDDECRLFGSCHGGCGMHGNAVAFVEVSSGASEVAARVPNGNSYSVTHWKSSSGLHIRE